MSQEVGRVLGSDPAHPLEFWVGVAEDQYLQLDDIVAVNTPVPGREEVTLYGVVDMVRAQYEGLAEAAARDRLSHRAFLAEVLGAELEERDARRRPDQAGRGMPVGERQTDLARDDIGEGRRDQHGLLADQPRPQ